MKPYPFYRMLPLLMTLTLFSQGQLPRQTKRPISANFQKWVSRFVSDG